MAAMPSTEGDFMIILFKMGVTVALGLGPSTTTTIEHSQSLKKTSPRVVDKKRVFDLIETLPKNNQNE